MLNDSLIIQAFRVMTVMKFRSESFDEYWQQEQVLVRQHELLSNCFAMPTKGCRGDPINQIENVTWPRVWDYGHAVRNPMNKKEDVPWPQIEDPGVTWRSKENKTKKL